MSDASARYRRLSSAFAHKIAAVPAGMWQAPTPCTDWTVRDLVAHVVEMNCAHSRQVGRPPRPGPGLDTDPVRAFTVISDQVQADLDDPVRAATEFDGPFGRCRFDDAIDQFTCFELAVHGWDLARATGQDEHIDPAEVERLWTAVERAGEQNLRHGDAFRTSRDTPAGPDPQQRLLAFLGRPL